MKTIFIPCRSHVDVERVAKDILKSVSFDKIALLSTAQFVAELPKIKKLLDKAGKMTVLNPGRPNPGQILGCDVRAAKGADAYVYIGTGRFHPLRVAYETGKPVFIAHPNGGIERLDDAHVMQYRKKQAARIDKFKQASLVGVLVSTKPGQNRMGQALKLREAIRGKRLIIFAANELRPEYLLGYRVDVWVNTACPRIAEDSFGSPIVDISELGPYV